VKRLSSLALAFSLLGGACVTAYASTTAVNALGAGNGAERCLEGYRCAGGSYNNALSLITVFEQDLGLAPGSFERLDDDFDKLWQNLVAGDGRGQVQALARYAGDKSRLGFDAGSGYVQLTSSLANEKVIVNNAFAYAGDPLAHRDDFIVAADSWITIPLARATPFAFVLNDLSMLYRITSNPESGVGSAGYANSGLALDYMVSYRVPDSVPHFFIAWEDRNPRLGNTGDGDYNDFIAEVRWATPMPEPQTYALILIGLGLLGFIARRRGAHGGTNALFH
jgi:hypothetical protein